jgi:amidase
VTTELAYLDPGPTRNPWVPEHTPGGSSQGSAAGVAAGLFPLALGSQTAGSTIRPASFCGAAALVPTRGRVHSEGVLPLAPSLDQLGIFARSVEDQALVFAALVGGPPGADPLERTPFLGIAREYFLATAEDEMGRMAIHAARSLAAAGANVHVVHLPASFAEVHRHHLRIMEDEAANAYRDRFAARRGDFGPKMAELIEAGLKVRPEDYRAALDHQDHFRVEIGQLLVEIDALVLPAAPSAAPHGLESTGDARFNVPWTNAGLPVVVLPAGRTAAGLPLGLQLVGAPGTDIHLLRVARYVEEQLHHERRIAPVGA